MSIPTLISAATFITGLIVSGKALLSRSELEQVFLSHEQKIKLYFLKLICLSGLIAILVADFYILWSLSIEKRTTETANWNFAIALAIVTFICGLIFLGTIERILQNFLVKYHFKYKVNIDNPDIGEVYIIKMMNQEICICSKNPNVDYVGNEVESILVKLDDLIHKPFIKEKVKKPKRRVWNKIME